MRNGDRRVIEAARALGFRAAKEADGGVSLTVPGDRLPPRLREIAEEIAASSPAPATAAELLVRVLIWARRSGHPVETVLADAAGAPFASSRTVPDLLAVLDRETAAAAEATGQGTDPVMEAELTGYLGELARRSRRPAEADRDDAEASAPYDEAPALDSGDFLARLGAGAFADPPPPIAPRDFADYVRRVGIFVAHAIARHGYTKRLRHLENMIGQIRDHGVARYESEDRARAARLMAMWPEIVEQLENYRPDPASEYDRAEPRVPVFRG